MSLFEMLIYVRTWKEMISKGNYQKAYYTLIATSRYLEEECLKNNICAMCGKELRYNSELSCYECNYCYKKYYK